MSKNPHYMSWPELNESFAARFADDEIDDDALFATRAETAALLSWVRHFERRSLSRTAEEQEVYDLIKRGAQLISSRNLE